MPSFILPPSSAYLVALSGGADSRLLLELTVRALLERDPAAEGGARVVAAHLHHGIRGAEADRDEVFCRAVCDRLGVPLAVEHVDIPARAAASGRSVETEARLARYDFFARTMAARRIPVLLTAHHADDQLETVLLHLLRGSGTKGMGGIPPNRPLSAMLDDGLFGSSAADTGALTVARPLLSWTKRDILTACREMDLDFITDSTNLADDCTRNRLRHTVIPALEAVAGEDIPQRAARRLGQAAREDDEALTAIARAKYGAARDPTEGVPVAALTVEMPAVAKRMILCAYADSLCGHRVTAAGVPPDRTLSAHHLEDILSLCRQGREGGLSDQLPSGVRACIRRGRLVFLAPSPPIVPGCSRAPTPLYEGVTRWDGGEGDRPAISVRIDRADAPLLPLTGDGVWASAVFPADRLPLPLWARTREAGDVILSHGMSKKLKKLLCDKHIPTDLRDRLPLVCIDGGSTPLWFPAAAFRDGYAAPQKGACLRVTVLIGTVTENGR